MKIPSLPELLEAGVHFGHQVRRGHPKMAEYIFGVREGVHIINLEQSEKLLRSACEFAKKLGEEKKVILFVGTKKQAQPIIKEAAEKVGAPYVNFRWMGGLLTNFDEIKKNIKKLTDLEEKKSKGELSKYTKKEQLLIDRKLAKFAKEWGGLAKMDKLPDAIFLADCVSEKTALAESRRLGLPIIGIADTNCNPLLLDYPIPGNDDATKSIKILIEAIAQAYGDGLGKEEAASKDKSEGENKKDKQVDIAPNADVVIAVEDAEEMVEKAAVEESARKE